MLSFKGFCEPGQIAGGAYATDDDKPAPEAIRRALGAVMRATGKTLEIVGGISHSETIRNTGAHLASKGQDMINSDPNAAIRATSSRTKQAIGLYMRQRL